MSAPTIEEILKRANVSSESLDQTECTDEDILELNLARFCDPWRLIGEYLRVPEDKLSAIDADKKGDEQKRSSVLKEWKQAHAFKATFLVLVKALFECQKANNAFKVCQLFKKRHCKSEAALGKWIIIYAI